MIHPWEFLETLDLRAWSALAAGASFDSHRAMQIVYALTAETNPRSAMQVGAYSADGACVLVAALNSGFIEEAHFVAAAPSDHFRAALTHARLPRHVHTYSETPVIIQADLWLVDGGDSQAMARAIENGPAIIAAVPPGSETWSAQGYTFFANADVRLGLNTAAVNEDAVALARDLVGTESVWWKE